MSTNDEQILRETIDRMRSLGVQDSEIRMLLATAARLHEDHRLVRACESAGLRG